MGVDIKSLAQQLHAEGFTHTYVWQDGSNVFYADHKHPVDTAHLILDGEMMVIQGKITKKFGVGERCDVPAGAVHAARMGPRGCRYLIGEK